VIVPRGRAPGEWSAIPPIAPPPAVADRPFWSVVIPTHEADDLLEATLRHVLAQDPGPDEMQIEVVDDGSRRADPEAVVERVGKGRVGFFRHPTNLGAPRTFNTCVERAVGEWVHVLHGDDVVLPTFYDAYREHIESHPCSMAIAQSFTIDEHDELLGVSPRLPHADGYLLHPPEVIAVHHPVHTVAVVARRDTYERVGGFRPGLVHANDWDMWTRLARCGPVACVPGAHAGYRNHPESDSLRLQQSMRYLTDPLDALEVLAAQFDDPAIVEQLRTTARRRLSDQAFGVARDAAARGARRDAGRNAWCGWRLRPTLETTASLVSIAWSTIR
jgi:GT2 family glycosyltransferase